MPLEFGGVAPSGGVTAHLWVAIGVSNVGSATSLREVGVFNAASGGTMLLRRVLPSTLTLSTDDYAYKVDLEIAVRDL